jgi:hypothetical protein
MASAWIHALGEDFDRLPYFIPDCRFFLLRGCWNGE